MRGSLNTETLIRLY